MAYWDEETANPTVVTKKRVWRVEIEGDLDGDFRFRAYIVKVKTEDGVELPPVDLGSVETTHDVAVLDPALEPSMTKIHNGCRALIRELRQA